MTARHATPARTSASASHAASGHRMPDSPSDDLHAEVSSPDRDQRIRELAYGFFVERGGAEGHALDDWLRAESTMAAREDGGSAPASAKNR